MGNKSVHRRAVKYEKYIILFTRLLCKLKKKTIEKWVSKEYFPADKCLHICREHANLHGLAILTKRSGKPLKAIVHYLEILTQIPINKLVE